MANHSLPSITSTYANFVTEMNDKFKDVTLGLDPVTIGTTPTNLPTGAIKWNSASAKWEKWSGSAWADLASAYAININGTVGATTPAAGAFTTLSSSGVASLGANSTVNSVAIVGTTLTQTLTNKTLTTPVLSATASGTVAGSLGYSSGVFTYGNGSAQKTVVDTDTSQTLTNKTMSTSSVWNGSTIAVGYGGTGTTTAPVQGGIIYGSSTTAYASSAVGTTGQILQSNATSAPTWVSFDLAVHAPDSSYKKIVRAATTADLGASSFATNALTGYPNTKSLACTTTAASTTITTSGSTVDLKPGAVVSTATVQVAAGTTVASISNATTFVVNNRANITTTAITGTSGTATATFAAQTYAPYAVGASIVISGATPATYNGTFTVTACTTTSVSWASAETVTATVQGTIAFTIAAGAPNLAFAQTIAAFSVDAGVTFSVGDRILVKDQSTLGGLTLNDGAKYNGIYSITTLGSSTVAWVITRTSDADASADLDSALVNVSLGTANGGATFKTTFKGDAVLNTAAMYWNRLIDINASSLIATPSSGSGIDINLPASSVQSVGGNVTNYAISALGQKTLTATSASTYTTASTLYIANAPSASTNVTITTPYALYIASGNSYTAGNWTLGGDIAVNGGDITTSATTFGLVDSTATTVNFAGAATTGNFGYDGTAASTTNISIGATAASTIKTVNIGTGGAASSTTNITLGATPGGTLTVNSPNSTFNQPAGGIFTIQASSAPTSDMVRITNSGQGVATAGASLFNIAFTGGAAAIESSAAEIAVTPSTTAASTWSALRVSPTAAAAASVNQYGVKFDAITTGAGSDSMIYGGSGWDNILNYSGTSIIDGTGIIRKAGGVTAGSATDSFVIYNGTTAAAGQFDGGTTTPTGTTRLNYGGILYPTGLNLIGTSDTATAASHYWVETDSDGQVRPKTLANVRTEVVTTAAVNAAAATTVGTITSGVWNGTTIAVANGGTGATTGDDARVNLNIITSTTGSEKVPVGTTAQRDGTPATGYFRFNTSFGKFEGYNGTAWGAVGGGATGGGADDIFIENGQSVTTNYTITTNKNAMSTGPITVANGVTVTVPNGSRWCIL